MYLIKRKAGHGVLALPLAIAVFIGSQPASAGPISALDIIPTFDSSITADANAASIESIINKAISFYDTNLTTATASPINVLIDFQEGGGLGSSLTGSDGLSYQNDYRPALISASSGDATDNAALAGLPASQPISGGDQIDVKTANARALGFNTPGIITINHYDGQITLNTSLTTPGSPGSSNQYTLLAVTEHEIDEVLGLGSDEGEASATGFFSHPAPEDLFRYTTGGARAWNQSTVCGMNDSGPLAFFSLDGTTDLSVFNNCANGGDYGDWYSAAGDFPGFGVQVQDAFANSGSAPFLTRTSPEVVALDAIGYDLTSATPEPGTLALLGGGFAALVFYRRRARRFLYPTPERR